MVGIMKGVIPSRAPMLWPSLPVLVGCRRGNFCYYCTGLDSLLIAFLKRLCNGLAAK